MKQCIQRSSMSCLALLGLLSTLPARSQEPIPTAADDRVITGMVGSSGSGSLIVRTSDGQFRFYVYDRNTIRPKTVPVGADVQVTSFASDDNSIRVASRVVILKLPGAAGATAIPTVPPKEARLQKEIEDQFKKFQIGFHAGVALDPELLVIGVNAQIGPIIGPFYLRPSVDFMFGEVTKVFAINADGVFKLPVFSPTGKWSAYAGIGPGFNFFHQNFARGNAGIDFGEFNYSIGLNILGGIRYRNGMFVEMRASPYSSPAPTFRMVIGYEF